VHVIRRFDRVASARARAAGAASGLSYRRRRPSPSSSPATARRRSTLQAVAGRPDRPDAGIGFGDASAGRRSLRGGRRVSRCTCEEGAEKRNKKKRKEEKKRERRKENRKNKRRKRKKNTQQMGMNSVGGGRNEAWSESLHLRQTRQHRTPCISGVPGNGLKVCG